MSVANDFTRFTMDTINLLFQRSLDPVKLKDYSMMKTTIPFVADSYDKHTSGTLKSADFLKDLLEFSQNEKDNINEETIELLEPYLTLNNPNGE
jgi:dynein heavy chain